MLPLKLSIEGLYSYQKKQTIDFNALTEAGLFGIFGAVGSGKSSVLEAIGFVLYGETERLNKTDKRSYNMLNLKSNQASIDFEFLNYENRKFKFVANWTRKKKFDETTPLSRDAYEWIDKKWIPLESADATPIIGLSYDNFRRTIIIPQGKFKEFLDLKGKDRSDMMKEIFQLQKYDLSLKVGILLSATKSQLDQLKGQLLGYDTISKEAIQLKVEEYQKASEILNELKEIQQKLEAEFTTLNTLKTHFEELENRKSELSKLLTEKPAIDDLQAEISEYEKVEKVFGVNILSLSQYHSNLEKAKSDYSNIEISLNSILETISSKESELTVIQPLFESLGEQQDKILDLESVVKVLNLRMQLVSLNLKIEEGNLQVTHLTTQENSQKDSLSLILNEIEVLKSRKTDTALLLAVGEWFTQYNANQEKLRENKNKIKSVIEEITSYEKSFEFLGLSVLNWEIEIETKRLEIVNKKKELEISKNNLLVAKEIAQFSHSLHEGESCPLCGSLDHPNPMQVVDLSDDIRIIESSILELQNQETSINQKNTEAQKNQLLLNHSKEQLAIFQNTVNELNEKQKLHLNSFIWSSFDVNDFQSYQAEKNAQEVLDSSIKELEVSGKDCRELLENIVNSLKAINENQLVLKTESATLNGVITNQLSQLKVLKFQDYENLDLEHIQTEKTNLQLNIDKITSDYKSITSSIDAAKENAAELKGKLDSYKERVETASASLEEIKVRINELLIENEYESLEAVQSILEKSFDIEVEKEKVKQFTVNLQTAYKLLEESKKIVEGKQFDLVIFREKELQAIKSKENVDTQIGIVASLVNELEKMKKELDEKEDLINQFSVLDSRATNLSMLSNLFSGNGFVNYVSRIYLQNLADVANVRFHRMTKNQLSLQINPNNEFEVIDYLNNGASRSVKTLSGGQGFQASLCLALALAESVQTLNKNDKNFFFIDEGFGTQDPDSVAVVFETLQSLYKENRVVGIISHVAELQERIPRSINVIKHEEKGSEIFENWN